MSNNDWQSTGLPYTCSDRQVTVIMPDGRPRSVLRSDTEKFDKVMDALRAGNWAEIPSLIDLATNIQKNSSGVFTVKNDCVYINDLKLPEALSNKIIAFSKENLPIEPLLLFWDNLQKNPSFRSVNQLYSFLERNNHAITPDGCFIAYKKVRENYTDSHTGTFDNSIGATVSMPRNQVNEDPEQTCSCGLHVANFSYASTFGGVRLIVVKVNPANVVAVPVDYNASKMRVCEYTVLSEIECEIENHTLYDDGSAPKPKPSYDDEADDYEEYDEDEDEYYDDEDEDEDEDEDY